MLSADTLLNGRYRVARPIGQGGMGAVYEAVDERLRAPVALKQTTVVGAELSRAFEREAQLLAGLRHPSLPRVIDHFIDPAGQFLVMEFIPGEDLAGMLRDRGAAFAPAQVLAWADQLLDALEYLHGQQPPVIHRDIKPQNLKLTPRGEIILLDFGLAKGRPALASAADSPGASVFGYTPQYAPIEQIEASGTDPRSDLYSLAATLYHMLTGQPPADTLSRASAALNGRPDPLIPADQINPAVPHPLAAALTQALALRADQRFASAAAMRRALGMAAAEAPAAATGPTVIARRPATVAPPAPRVEEHYSVTDYSTARDRPARARRRGRGGRGGLLGTLLALGIVLFLLAIFANGLRNRRDSGNQAETDVAMVVVSSGFETATPGGPATADQSGQALPEAKPITLDAQIADTIGSPGQQLAYRFSAEPGQQIFVWTARADDKLAQLKLRLLDSRGDEVASTCLGCGNMGTVSLSEGGDYTLVVGSDRDPATGAFELRVSVVPPASDFTLPIDARIVDGQPGPGAGEVEKPGAVDLYTFTAQPGQQVFVWTASYDKGMEQIKLRLFDSRGDELTNTCLGCGNLGAVTLRQGGNYILIVGSDSDPAVGAYEIRLSAVPPDQVTTVSLPAEIGDGAIDQPGAKQAYAFTAQPGQQIFITTAGFDKGMEQIKLRLLDDRGDEVAGTCLGCGNLGTQTLSRGGEYRLVVGSDSDPATGGYQLRVDPVQ